MKITIVALGTRGDVQPMLALSIGLRSAGHDITLIAGSNFESWVRSYGFGFRPSLDMEALIKSPQGVAWVEEPNQFRQLQHMKALLKPHGAEMIAPIVEQAQHTDLIISGFVSEPFAQSASEKFGIPQVSALLQPHRATRSSWAAFSPVMRGDNLLNYWIGKLGERLIWNVAAETVNTLRTMLKLPPHTPASYAKASRFIPRVYGFSRCIVPPATDWTALEQIAGYWFLDEESHWQPPDTLVRFLESGTPPVYIGFGSMSSSNPQQTVDLVTDALQRAGQRGILAVGWSGAQVHNTSPNVFMLDKAPHDWLFQHVAGIVHHGGSGTTGAALRSGKPSLIIPHMSDQPFWSKRVHALGVSAKPIPRDKLTAEKLAAGIQTLVSNGEIQRKAAELGAKIRAEDGVANAVRILTGWIEQPAS